MCCFILSSKPTYPHSALWHSGWESAKLCFSLARNLKARLKGWKKGHAPPICPLLLLVTPAMAPHPWHWQLLPVATVGSNFQSLFFPIVSQQGSSYPLRNTIINQPGHHLQRSGSRLCQGPPLSSWETGTNWAVVTPQRSESQFHGDHLSSETSTAWKWPFFRGVSPSSVGVPPLSF